MKYNKNIIGLTGLYCSGKSSVEKILKEEFGFFIIDADKAGHKALQSEKDAIVSNFGKDVLRDGFIDRRALSAIVFGNKDRLSLLNSIVHPVMIKEIEQAVQNTDEKNICINAALLFQMKLDKMCGFVIFLKACIFTILYRALKRDKRSISEVLNIIKNQKKDAFSKKNLINADIVYINNNRDLGHLRNEVKKILAERI